MISHFHIPRITRARSGATTQRNDTGTHSRGPWHQRLASAVRRRAIRRSRAIGGVVAGLLATLVITGVTAPAHAQLMPQRATVIENVRIYTMSDDGEGAAGVIDRGSIVLRGSRIVAVGADVEIPRRANRIDGSGLVATPGLIDVASAVGMTSIGGGSPTLHAYDAFDPYDTINLTEVLRNGVTTIHVAPRSAGLGGQSSIIRLERRSSGDAGGRIGSAFRERVALFINLDSSARTLDRLNRVNQIRSIFRAARLHQEALETYEEELAEYIKKIEERSEASDKQSGNGESTPSGENGPRPAPAPEAEPNRRRGSQPGPRPRTGSDLLDTNSIDGDSAVSMAALQDPRQRRRPPQRGRQSGGEGGGDDGDDELKKPERPARNPAHETLIRVLEHELPVHIEADRSEDILNALKIAAEFNIRIVLEGASEAHLVADAIADADVPVVLAPPADTAIAASVLARQQRHAALGLDDDIVGALDRQGVTWVLGTGGRDAAAGRFLLMQAQRLAQRTPTGSVRGSGGIDPLALVTAQAADFLGIGDDVGRLKAGTYADIVLWTGDPLDPASHVQQVYIGGRLVYEHADRRAADDRQGGAE